MRRLGQTIVGLCLAATSIAAGAYEITDSFGRHQFERVPQRVVVTDWTLLNNLLRLGITPVGAPETQAYLALSDQPDLPDTVSDIGLRVAPSPERIQALKPDLIIIGTGQKELARPLSRLAKVVYLKNFSDRYRTNGSKSRERWLQLAAIFQREAMAESALTAMDQKITELADESQAHGPIALIQMHDDQSLILFGDNALPGYAARQLKLSPALVRKPRHWGESDIKMRDLKALDEKATVLLFATSQQHVQFKSSADSQHIRARVIPLEPLWPYGGALDVLQIAERIADALR